MARFPGKHHLTHITTTILIVSSATAHAIQPFSTDGCSLFPDHALIGKADWCSCCLVHDLAYWRGGTADQRLAADEALKSCVLSATGNAELADLVFAGVRLGGGPYYFTPYRWGYGWPYGRQYAPLTREETADADMLQSRYVESNPTLSCPTATHLQDVPALRLHP